MAIMMKGTRTEFAFIRFHGNGVVDAMDLTSGQITERAHVSRFKADGGTNEIMNEIKNLPVEVGGNVKLRGGFRRHGS